MRVKLTTLSENTATPRRGILGEHGLSIYVEAGDTRLIFDTGQTTTAVHNAEVLGIDLLGAAIALSHGHYDHSGGLESVLEKTGPAAIYCHPEVFGPKYSFRGKLSYIGMPLQRDVLETMGARFDLSREAQKIAPRIWLTGEVPRRTEFELPSRDLLVETDKGMVVDPLLDDQALILVLDRGLLVVLGCAHSGTINTLEQAKRVTDTDRIVGVVGGTHLGFGNGDKLTRTVDALKKYDLEVLGASHCTGPKAAAVLAAEFGERFVFNSAGTVIEL